MGAVSILLVHYRITLYPSLAFLSYISWTMLRRSRISGSGVTMQDAVPPILIAAGLAMMHTGTPRAPEISWTWRYLAGETLVIGMFTYNSITSVPRTPIFISGVMVAAFLLALWFRGNVWNYLTAVMMQVVLAIFVAMAFPVMELILEAILNDKLRKVGDKVREHHRKLQAYYQAKLDKQS